MDYLGSRGVMSSGTDSPSMGPIPDLAEPTHYAGLKHGMIWTESVTGLGSFSHRGVLLRLGAKACGVGRQARVEPSLSLIAGWQSS